MKAFAPGSPFTQKCQISRGSSHLACGLLSWGLRPAGARGAGSPLRLDLGAGLKGMLTLWKRTGLRTLSFALRFPVCTLFFHKTYTRKGKE